MGQWAAPFGITLVADYLSAVMVVITAITALAVAVYALSDIDEARGGAGLSRALQFADRRGDRGVPHRRPFQPLCLVRGDADLVLRASVLGGRREQIDGGVKYVTLNLSRRSCSCRASACFTG
jgi:multicomponent Na+:H+ antiporter subunit D